MGNGYLVHRLLNEEISTLSYSDEAMKTELQTELQAEQELLGWLL